MSNKGHGYTYDHSQELAAQEARLRAEHTAEVERLRADHSRALAVAQTDARNAERTRIAGILSHAAASTRPTQAKALAFETDLSVETVARILSNSPAEETAESAGQRMLRIMEERSAHLQLFGADHSGSAIPSKTGPLDRAIAAHNRNVKK